MKIHGSLQRQGINPDMYFKSLNYSRRQLQTIRSEAESRTKTSLVIEAVAKAEGFDATEEEIQKEIEQLAADF